MKDDTRNVIIVIVVIALAILLFLNWNKIAPKLQSIAGGFGGSGGNGGLNPDQVENEVAAYDVRLTVTPSNGCIGDQYTGTITSNMPNGQCGVWIDDGSGWRFLFEFNLDDTGRYSQDTNINTMGTYSARAVCMDNQHNFRMSNTVTIIVRDCNNPNNEPDDGNEEDENIYYCCQYGIDRECYANGCPAPYTSLGGFYTLTGCENDCYDLPDGDDGPPDGFSCYNSCQGSGYLGGTGPVDSPGRCTYPDVYQYYSGNGCCCYNSVAPLVDCPSYCNGLNYQIGAGIAGGVTCSQLATSQCNGFATTVQSYASYPNNCCCINCNPPSQPPRDCGYDCAVAGYDHGDILPYGQSCSPMAIAICATYGHNRADWTTVSAVPGTTCCCTDCWTYQQ
jgi:hypothetical protein